MINQVQGWSIHQTSKLLRRSEVVIVRMLSEPLLNLVHGDPASHIRFLGGGNRRRAMRLEQKLKGC